MARVGTLEARNLSEQCSDERGSLTPTAPPWASDGIEGFQLTTGKSYFDRISAARFFFSGYWRLVSVLEYYQRSWLYLLPFDIAIPTGYFLFKEWFLALYLKRFCVRFCRRHSRSKVFEALKRYGVTGAYQGSAGLPLFQKFRLVPA